MFQFFDKLNYEDKWKKNKSLDIKCIRYPIYSKFIEPDMSSHAPGVIPEASEYKSYVHQFYLEMTVMLTMLCTL